MRFRSNSQNKTSHKKHSSTVVIVLLLLILVLINLFFVQLQKPDSASEAVIRQAAAKQINKDPNPYKEPNDLIDEDFASITELNLIKKELSDIKLLKKFNNLQFLDITSISHPNKETPGWMSFLSKTGIIDIKKRFELDISPIEKLLNIKRLSLQSCEIYNLEPLKHLNNLEILLLYKSPVKNIKSLSYLTNIRVLSLDYLEIKSLEPIKGLTNIRHLYINGTLVSELESLKELTHLSIIELRETHISDLKPLRGLRNLNFIDLRNTPVTNLEPLYALKNLQELDIRSCQSITERQINELQNALPELEIRK